MAQLITPHILHDHPPDPEQAEFYFDDYANTFARLIADRNTRTPLVLGLSGAWGSGKTTLLRLIQSKLNETLRREQDARYSFLGEDSEGDFRQCRTVWFNAWKYAEEDELLVALVRVIVQTMYADDWVSKSWAAIFDVFQPRRDVINTVLGWFAIKTPFGDVKPDTGAPQPTTFAEKTALLDLFSEAFDRLMAAWVHRNPRADKVDPARGVMVVFVDDLDRCLPDKAVQVLEAIKLFLDRPGVAFVLAADEAAIRAAVEAHYQSQHITGLRAADYLEKIFQVRFALPPLSAPQASGFLHKSLEGVDESLRESLDLILAGAEINPRRIKTFVNYLDVGWAVLRNSGQAQGVAQADFLRWLALTQVGPAFCEKVRELLPDRRLDYIADAARWAADPAHKAGEYQEWQGPDHRRLRNVLKLTQFSARVTPEVLNGFIFWSAPETPPSPTPSTTPEAARPADESPDARRIAGVPEAKLERAAGDLLPSTSPFAPGYWVTIPAGKFVMGSRDENREAFDQERPQHTVEIPYAYRIARYPVTNALFREFVKATGYKTEAEKQGKSYVWDKQVSKWVDTAGANWQHPLGPQSTLEGLDDHPVAHISWRDARAYADWLTTQLRPKGLVSADEVTRLPSEAEWEKAARGEYGKEYPWGDTWDPARCNNAESGPGTTTPVGQYSPAGDSPYGLADMVGNVWEWTQSKFKPYPYTAGDGREDLEGNDSRVLRGGAFSNPRRLARCAYRLNAPPDARSGRLGFRVVVVSPGSRS